MQHMNVTDHTLLLAEVKLKGRSVAWQITCQDDFVTVAHIVGDRKLVDRFSLHQTHICNKAVFCQYLFINEAQHLGYPDT